MQITVFSHASQILSMYFSKSICAILLIVIVLNSATSIAQVSPSIYFPDLKHFKINFPLDAMGNDYTGVSYNDRDNPFLFTQETQRLENYVAPAPFDQYYYLNSNNELVFKAHCAAALTSINAYPRCELRQTQNGALDLWDFNDQNELNATFRVTHLPDIKQEVCMLQIKGSTCKTCNTGTEEAFRLEYRQDGDDGLHVTINENSEENDIMDYVLGQTIVATMQVNNCLLYTSPSPRDS